MFETAWLLANNLLGDIWLAESDVLASINSETLQFGNSLNVFEIVFGTVFCIKYFQSTYSNLVSWCNRIRSTLDTIQMPNQKCFQNRFPGWLTNNYHTYDSLWFIMRFFSTGIFRHFVEKPCSGKLIGKFIGPRMLWNCKSSKNMSTWWE